MKSIVEMTRDELLALVRVYAKNWLAHDGCWFLAAEESLGLEAAIDLDTKSWARFAPAEARRIMREFGIAPNGGLKALEQALGYRLYAAVNPQEIRWLDDRTLEFTMAECRVQKTRQSKGLAPFPCRPVGMVEFSGFASAVDPSIRCACRRCPPDPGASAACSWVFTTGPG